MNENAICMLGIKENSPGDYRGCCISSSMMIEYFK